MFSLYRTRVDASKTFNKYVRRNVVRSISISIAVCEIVVWTIAAILYMPQYINLTTSTPYFGSQLIENCWHHLVPSQWHLHNFYLPVTTLFIWPRSYMMTSSNGNIFRVTDHLCGEFTVTGEFPAQRPVTQSFGVFFDLRLNKWLSKHSWGWWFETPSRSLWRHCNEDLPQYNENRTCGPPGPCTYRLFTQMN